MSDDDYQSIEENGWIQWFCKLDDHHFFCQIEPDYFRDPFNSYGVKNKFENFDQVLNFLLSENTPQEDDFEKEQFIQMHQEATNLYGLMHARYIQSPKGLAMMREKFLMGAFGRCPRIDCEKQNLLPIGLSNNLRISRVKVYCARCQDIFNPKKKVQDIDGSFFGTSFPHILLKSYDDFQIKPYCKEFIPTIYGFRLYKQPGSRFLQEDKSLKKRKK